MAAEQVVRGETSRPPAAPAPSAGGPQASAQAGTSQPSDPEIAEVLKKYGNDPAKLATAIRAAQKEAGKFQSERDSLRNQVMSQQQVQRNPPPVDDFAEMRSRVSLAAMEPLTLDEDERNALVYEGDASPMYRKMEARFRQAAREEFQLQQTAAQYKQLAEDNKELFERFGNDIISAAEEMSGNLPKAIEYYQMKMEVEKLKNQGNRGQEAAAVAGIKTAVPATQRPGVPAISGVERTGPRSIQEIALEQLQRKAAP